MIGGCGAAPEVAAPVDAAGTAAPGPSVAVPSSAADAVERVEFRYADGAVEGGVTRHVVPVGSTVEVVVRSDVADEVHLHGYDEVADVAAGEPATLRFVADVPGVFEIELHDTGDQLGQLAVS